MRLQLHATERSSCAVLLQQPHRWTLPSSAGHGRGTSTHTLKTDMLLAQDPIGASDGEFRDCASPAASASGQLGSFPDLS